MKTMTCKNKYTFSVLNLNMYRFIHVKVLYMFIKVLQNWCLALCLDSKHDFYSAYFVSSIIKGYFPLAFLTALT